MAKVLLKDIDPREQKQIVAAENAILKGNPGFAVETCQAVLSRHPECTEVRRILRKAQKRATGKKPIAVSGLGRLFGSLGAPSKSACEKDPQKSLIEAEKALSVNPYDTSANLKLAFAAGALEIWDAVALAYEGIVACDPKPENYAKQINALLKDEDVKTALEVSDAALKKFPASGEVQELARQVSVAQTMLAGKWESGGDFHDKLANKEKAIELEQKNRVVSDADVAVEQIPKLAAEIEKDPENVQIYRELARNYRVVGDLDNAVAVLQKARETANGKIDATLEKLEHAYTLENYENRIKEAQNVLAENPANEEYKKYLAELTASLADYRLQSTKMLVEKYPNDYNYRYDLGTMLLNSGDVNGAIQQLQIAQRSPKNRQAAMLALGRAFIAGEKYDMAVDQLVVARDEIKTMSDTKKDIIYELAIAYEKSGKSQDAATEYKTIYMADAAYKDVSAKVNSLYEKK